MLFFEAEYGPDLLVGDRGFVADKRTTMRRIGTDLLEEVPGRLAGRDRVIDGIEDLEAKSVLADGKMNDSVS